VAYLPGALVAFFTKFSQFAGNDFYLTSESYGGHYLPTTTKYILDQPGAAAALNLKGFFLGNPWTDPTSNAVGRVQTLYGILTF
jgi:carboxypeptidase C (cathepsin A)